MKRILLFYTGGTIGCEGVPLAPMPAATFADRLAGLGLIPASVEVRSLEQPLDSANMQPSNWLAIAACLLDAWSDFDGFVVLHGTDTLAYTAAALSFLLPGLNKPIVITGSQHPLSTPASDAARNLRDALAVACCADLHEVVVCFAGGILRGNRSVKRSAAALAAFDSPNWPPLGEVVDGLVLAARDNFLPAAAATFDVGKTLRTLGRMREALKEARVWVVHLHPGLCIDVLHAVLAMPTAPRAWILACYGVGNAPEDAAFLDALKTAHDRGVVLLAITQTGHGRVEPETYQAGVGLARAGVIAGRDLVLPAAVARLQLLFASGLSPDAVREALSEAVAGEMTAP